jgi:hypothetical protein
MPRFAGAPSDVSPEDANKRTKLLLIALAAVVVIAAVYWFLVKPALSKSSDNASGAAGTTAPATLPTPGKATKPKAVPTPSTSPSPSPETFSGSTRDPFAPLPAELVGSTTSASGTTSSATAAPIPAPSVTANPSPTPSTPAAGTHSITVVTISSGSADLTADGKDKTVKAGDTVEKGVSCIKVTDDSVFITYQSKAYAIAPGQTVTF